MNGENVNAGETARCLKVKQLLVRYNMVYEERSEGNTVIIDIKTKITNGLYALPKGILKTEKSEM
jgi:hypothetical protein